ASRAAGVEAQLQTRFDRLPFGPVPRIDRLEIVAASVFDREAPGLVRVTSARTGNEVLGAHECAEETFVVGDEPAETTARANRAPAVPRAHAVGDRAVVGADVEPGFEAPDAVGKIGRGEIPAVKPSSDAHAFVRAVPERRAHIDAHGVG